MEEQDLRQILSLNIKRYRNYRKLSQEKLAEKIDISTPFLSDLENGKKWVSPRTLVKLADAFNIEAYELLRPGKTVPDNAAAVIEQYTADIYVSFEQTLNKLQSTYMAQLSEK
jgi:transcriptional regulator with XRE-family HTH domain